MPNPTHDKPNAQERERAQSAVALRIEGRAYAEIADALGYSDESGARHAVSRLLDRREAESVEELRMVEGCRLDAMQAAVWDAALHGDLDAIKAVLGIMARRARLFGLDKPTAVAVGISETEFAAQAAELLAVLGPEPLRELAQSVPESVRALPGAATAAVPGVVYGGEVDEGWSNLGVRSRARLT